MVVDGLYVVRVGSEPPEADAPLIVDADAMLSRSIPGELFKMVCGRDSEVEKAHRSIKHE